LSPHQGPNDEWYWSGCGPTAWAITLAWEDREAEKGDPRFAPYWRIYHRDGALDPLAPNDAAPFAFAGGAQRMVIDLRNILGTWGVPFSNDGSTEPWRMSRVNTYMQRLGFLDGEIEAATYDWGGGDFDSLRDRAIQHVCIDSVPAVIGIGALTHYAVATEAWGYWFWLNMGHGGGDDGWYAPGVFFAGTMLPKKQPILPPAAVIDTHNECLDIAGGSTASGTIAIAWDCKSTDVVNQRWWLDPDGELRGITEKCLDVDHANPADGARVQDWDCNGTSAQHWWMDNLEIVHRSSGRCLDVSNPQNLSPMPVQLSDCHDAGTQHWVFTAKSEIRNASKCLAVASGNLSNAAVLLLDCDGSVNERWILKPGGVMQAVGARCLDLVGNVGANGTALQVGGCLGTPTQQFSLRGMLKAVGGKCLTAMGTQANPTSWRSNGIQMWTCYGTDNQFWTYWS